MSERTTATPRVQQKTTPVDWIKARDPPHPVATMPLFRHAVPLVAASVMGCTRFPAPGPEPDINPNAAWKELLEQATTRKGVRYAHIEDNRDVLDDFLSWVAVHGPNADDMRESKEDRRISILANAYNAHVIQAVLHHKPVDSVLEVGGGLWALSPGAGFFHGQVFAVNGEYRSLYFLAEQDLVARYQDPIVRMVLTSGAVGSPPLRHWPDRGLTSRIKRHLRKWLTTDAAMRWDSEDEVYALNAVFFDHTSEYDDWSDDLTVCDYLSKYAVGDRQDWLKEHAEDCPVTRIPVDWSLNADASPYLAPPDPPDKAPSHAPSVDKPTHADEETRDDLLDEHGGVEGTTEAPQGDVDEDVSHE